MQENQENQENQEVELKEIIQNKEEQENILEYNNEERFFGTTRIGKEDPTYNDEDVIVGMKNVHKTYLLGIEGVPALRYHILCSFDFL